MTSQILQAFDEISAAMIRAAQQRSFAEASAEGERHGLVEQGDGKPSQRHVWERTDQGWTLRFGWRWYDQSKVFSTQPDMNILWLELIEGDTVVRRAEERYED